MPLYYSNFKSFSNKISRIFLFEQLYVWPLLAILKGQYLPWANRERPVEHFYGLESTLWRYRKLPCDQHQNLRLLMQNMATLLDTFQLQKVFLSAYIGHSAYMLYLPQFMTRKGLYRNFNYDSASWKLKNANSSNWSYWKHVYSTSASVVYVFIGHNSHPLLIITLYWRILW